MKFLNGFKTIIGAIGMVVTIVLPHVSAEVVGAVGASAIATAQGVFGLLLALGLIHKAEKATAP